MTNVFFCNSGLEANEAALKIARKFGVDKGIAKPEIVVYEKAFHGRSIATMSATGNPRSTGGFGPLVEGFIRVPLNDIEAIKQRRGNPNVVAVCSSKPSRAKAASTHAPVEYLRNCAPCATSAAG